MIRKAWQAVSANLTYRQKLIFLIVGMATVRAFTTLTMPLFSSESYYWMWGSYPAAGYDFHPPMVGLLSRLFFGWLGGSQLGARAAPIILGAASTALVFLLTRTLFGAEKTAWRAAMLFSLIPIYDALSLLIEPDNSLICFALLTWLLFWKAVQRRESLGLWLATGVAAGLTLLSKFHAWALLPPLYGFLLFSRENRPLLRRAGPWLAIVLALPMLTPNLVWNSQHDWPNYLHAWHRSGVSKSGFKVLNLFNFVAGSAAILSPLVFVAVVKALVRGIRSYRQTGEPALLFLLCAGVALPLFLGLLTLRSSISLHWLAAGLLPLVILMAALMERGELFGPRYQRWMWGVCLTMTALIHIGPPVVALVPKDFEVSYFNKKFRAGVMTSTVTDWREIGKAVNAVRDEMQAQAPTVIMGPSWHMAAHLAFYTERPRECFSLADDAANFGIWMAQRGWLRGHDAVVVYSAPYLDERRKHIVEQEAKNRKRLAPLFAQVEPGRRLVFNPDGTLSEHRDLVPSPAEPWGFLIYRCHGFKGELLKGRSRGESRKSQN